MARLRHGGNGISYSAESVEAYSKKSKKFEVAISNMAASSAPDLQEFLIAARRVLESRALFVFTIPTHVSGLCIGVMHRTLNLITRSRLQ